MFLAFWIGIYPAPLFDVLKAPVDRLMRGCESRLSPAGRSCCIDGRAVPPPMAVAPASAAPAAQINPARHRKPEAK